MKKEYTAETEASKGLAVEEDDQQAGDVLDRIERGAGYHRLAVQCEARRLGRRQPVSRRRIQQLGNAASAKGAQPIARRSRLAHLGNPECPELLFCSLPHIAVDVKHKIGSLGP